MRANIRWRLIFTVLIALALVAAACGEWGHDHNSNTADSNDTAASDNTHHDAFNAGHFRADADDADDGGTYGGRAGSQCRPHLHRNPGHV